MEKRNIIVHLFFATLFVTFAPEIADSSIEYQEVKNKDNVNVFAVLNHHWINIHNLHRALLPSIQLSLSGAKIESVETRNSALWILHLSDSTTIDLKIDEKTDNVTEYYLNWHGGGPNESREVCLHYAYNDANW